MDTAICEWYVVRCRSKNEHRQATCLEEIGLRAQNMPIILESIVNIIGRRGRGDEHKNPHFDNERDLHTRSKYYKTNGFGRDLDLLIISKFNCVFPYLTKSRCREKKVSELGMSTLDAYWSFSLCRLTS